jgi:stage IV sporulation protein FB
VRWSFVIGTFGGTQIRIHATFLLLVGWYAWAAARTGGTSAGISATIFLLSLFLCILLHEFGHIGMARRFGVRTPEVILSPIGGLARLERMPDEPRQELLIALAGPAVTALIAMVLWLVLALMGTSHDPGMLGQARMPLLPGLLYVNVSLLIFNLIPAFPMDGGRVLRAILAKRKGMLVGTRIAARVGQGFAIALGLLALAESLPLLLLIAGFIFLGAQAEAAAVESRVAGRGLRATQMMVTDFRILRVHATLREAADALLAGEQRDFPVVDNLGRLEGMLTRDHLIQGLTRHGPDTPVSSAMAPVPTPVSADLAFDAALTLLRQSGLSALPVVGPDGALVGLLTLDNIADLVLVRRASGST